MATKLKAEPGALYEEGFYVWTARQAELLRAPRFDELDLENLTQEVEDLGTALKNAVRNTARVILEHLLELQHSPAQEPRNGWRDTILEHRARLEGELTPQLRRLLEQDLPQVYGIAQRKAARSMRVHDVQAAAGALPPLHPRAGPGRLAALTPTRSARARFPPARRG